MPVAVTISFCRQKWHCPGFRAFREAEVNRLAGPGNFD
jgi:hypothetical protein